MYFYIFIPVTLSLSFVFIPILVIVVIGFCLFFYAGPIPGISYFSHMCLSSSLLSTQSMITSLHISMLVSPHSATTFSYDSLFFTSTISI